MVNHLVGRYMKDCEYHSQDKKHNPYVLQIKTDA